MTCVNWAGTISRDGYGRQWVNSVRRYKQAHRIAYCQAHGIPISAIDGLVIRHTCDNRRCVNPAHLVTGSPADNSQGMVDRNRQAKGVRNGNSKLTSEDVAMIRTLYVKGSRELGGPALGRRFGVTSTSINLIVRGKHWHEGVLQEKGM